MFELLLQADKSLAAGALVQAERTYWQLVDLDPSNAMALAGQARERHRVRRVQIHKLPVRTLGLYKRAGGERLVGLKEQFEHQATPGLGIGGVCVEDFTILDSL